MIIFLENKFKTNGIETLLLRVYSLLLGTANKPIQKSAYEKNHFIVLIGTYCLNKAKPFSLLNATQILCIGKVYHGWKSIFSEIFDFSPECPEAGTFPISLEKAHKSAHRLQQGCSAVVTAFWKRKS